MKNDINGCSQCAAGSESFERFRRDRKWFFQYDYRTASGRLFSTAASTLDVCRKRRDVWLENSNGGSDA